MTDLQEWILDSEPTSLAEVARYFDLSAADWRAISRAALIRGLQAAARSPFHRARVGLDPAAIAADPDAALLAFPALTKRTYWDHAADLRLDGYAERVAHTFHTSGTELGVPTEQPWDDWTFRRSFCQSSALALVRAGATAGSAIVIGSPSFGALARSYAWAAATLGLEMQSEGTAFSDPAAFAPVAAFLRDRRPDTLVATPGGTVAFVDRVREAGLDPLTIGIRRVVSGIGNFLTDRHVDFLRAALDPEIIVEQGGKNEILHAPGAIRLWKGHPERTCAAGYLHYLPHVSHVVAVDGAAFEEGRLVPVGHEQRGVLLMTRLSAGRDPIVAYVNDAGDLGMTRGIGEAGSLCPCGNPMPAFRFLGRVTGCLSNRLGDTLFTEEFGQALAAACAAEPADGVPPAIAVGLRLQIVLVRHPDWEQPDRLCWLLGVPPEAMAAHGPALRRLCDRFLERWVGHATYASGRYARYMTIGRGLLVDVAAFPHAGRDKPQYKLQALVEATPGQPLDAAFVAYVERELRARVLG
jgi:hypothetical protein